MAQPPFVTAGAASAGTGDGFATTVAVLLDLGSSGNIGLVAQAYLDGGGGLGEIPPITVGGTLTGGTTTGSGAGARNRDGTITGGTELTMESLIPGSGSYLGVAGAARAGRIAGLSLTGLQWVQLRAEYLGEPTAATKPLLLCAASSGVTAIPAGTPVAAATAGGALSQSLTTTANDVAVILLHTTAADADTFTPSGTTVQRLRALGADQFSGYNGLILDEPGIAGTTAIAGSFASAGTVPYAGTKWVLQGTAGGDTTAPTITGPSGGAGASTSAVSVPENTTAVHTFAADESVTWDISGGADAARFTIGSGTGALVFNTAPNFESPTDADTNNTYVVTVRATDTATPTPNTSTQTCTVTVINANEAPTFPGPSIGARTGIAHVHATRTHDCAPRLRHQSP